MNNYQKLSGNRKELEEHYFWSGPVKNVLIFLLLSVCLICILSACENKVPKETQKQIPDEQTSEEQISNDIQKMDVNFRDYNFKLDSFSVIKRQTNLEDKNDFVWCKIAASNQILLYSAEYELKYVLYNEGWLLDECNPTNSTLTPASPPTQDPNEARALVLAEFDKQNAGKFGGRYVYQQSVLQKRSDLSYTYYIQIAYYKEGRIDELKTTNWGISYQFDYVSGWKTEVLSDLSLNWDTITILYGRMQ